MELLPSWRIHLKWAELFGIGRDVAEIANRVVDDPSSVPLIGGSFGKIVGHDWGRRSKSKRCAMRSIQKSFMRQHYGPEGVWAVELHHLLDHIAYLCDPKRLAQERLFKRVSQLTSGMSLQDRTRIMKEVLKGIKIKADVSDIPDKDYITNRLLKEAFKLEVSNEVWEFINTHLDQILADIKRDTH